MEYVKKRLAEIRPYENNPRVNDGAVDDVVESIRQCSYIAPIIVDEDGVILAGHTRYKALGRLGAMRSVTWSLLPALRKARRRSTAFMTTRRRSLRGGTRKSWARNCVMWISAGTISGSLLLRYLLTGSRTGAALW